MAVIASADSSISCYGDWFEAISNIYGPRTGLKVPLVYVRVSPVTVRHMTYTRRVPEEGSMQTFEFSAHLFHRTCTLANNNNVACEKYKHAHDIADLIVDALEQMDWHNDATYGDSAICDVVDLNIRESEPKRGAKRLCRIIIEGTIFAKRQD